MNIVLGIALLLVLTKSIAYKAAFLTLTHWMMHKKSIRPTNDELKECSGYVLKHKWIQILL